MQTKHPKIFTRPEFYLRQAALSFNSTCNASCKYCCGRITEEPCIPLEKAKEVLNVVIRDLRIKDIYPTCSAELTLYPYLLDIIKYCDSLKVPYVRITQDTNGRYIPDGFIELLNSVSIYWTISVSCWGYDEESWTENQGKGDFNTFVKNIKRYISELKIAPSFSLVSINEEQRDKTIAFLTQTCKECGKEVHVTTDGLSEHLRSFKERGIVPILVRNYRCPIEEGSNISYVHNNENPEEVKPFCDYNNCVFVYLSIILDSAGYIYPCLSLNGKRDYAIGNIYDYEPFTKESLLEMIHSEKGMNYWIKNYTQGQVACDICSTCTTRCTY